MRGKAVLAQLSRQAGLVALGLVEYFDAFGRAVVELVVVATQHRVEAADGLVAVQDVIGCVHAALGPGTEVRHQVFLVAAFQGLAVGAHVGAGNALQGDDQDVARTPRFGQQSVAIEIQAGQPSIDGAGSTVSPSSHCRAWSCPAAIPAVTS